MKRFGLVLAVVALVVVAARPAMAQGATGSLRYGIFGGVIMPTGDYNTADKMGFTGGVGATYWLPAGNVGVRGDVSYTQSSHDGAGGNTKFIGGMASVVYALMPASAPARVMITAGVGLYNAKISLTGFGEASETKVGFGGGAAVAFRLGTGSTRLVLGTRYQSVQTDPSLSFIPITLGLSFGK